MRSTVTRKGRTRDVDGRMGSGNSFPSPSSSSSSDFEFTVALSPSKRSCSQLCPADELFYKGQLLPLHLSPRISMVRTLILASSSTSSSDTTTTASRDSNGSSSSSFSADLAFFPDCDSSCPSSVTEEDARRISVGSNSSKSNASSKISSFATRFSSVFLHRGSKKDPPAPSADDILATTTTKRANLSSSSSSSAKEVIKKYVKMVKPLYEKLSSLQQIKQNHKQQQDSQQQQQDSQGQQQQQKKKTFSFSIRREKLAGFGKKNLGRDYNNSQHPDHYSHSQSFSGHVGCPMRKQWAASCPSSMKSSPSHSGLLCVGGGGFPEPTSLSPLSTSSMEELQSAIQGAIAHCKSSMVQANQNKAAEPAPAPVCNREEISSS